jgi:hypothetical protein
MLETFLIVTALHDTIHNAWELSTKSGAALESGFAYLQGLLDAVRSFHKRSSRFLFMSESSQ